MPSPLPRGDEGEEAYEECLTPSKGGRFKFGQRKKVITAAKPPPPLAKPGVDAWAQEFYDGIRRTLLEMGVVKLLVGIIFDGTAMDASVDDQRSNVVFHALENLLELIKHNCCAEKDLNAMLPACAGVLSCTREYRRSGDGLILPRSDCGVPNQGCEAVRGQGSRVPSGRHTNARGAAQTIPPSWADGAQYAELHRWCEPCRPGHCGAGGPLGTAMNSTILVWIYQYRL